MDRDLVKGNKLCYNFEQERMKQIHKHNLQVAQAQIRTQIDRLAQNPNKKLQLQEEKCTEIERENRILLEKIQNIMNHERKRANSNWTSKTNPSDANRKPSLNKEKRKKELVRITIENQKMFNRLTAKKANYETRFILRQTFKQQQWVQQIGEYPLKRSRIQSSKRQKSADLSKSSFMGGVATQITPTQQKRIVLYKQNKIIHEQLYHIEVFYEDKYSNIDNSNFKITADDSTSASTKVFEMPLEDGQMVLREIFNNNILQLVEAISVDNNIHIKGLEQFEEVQ